MKQFLLIATFSLCMFYSYAGSSKVVQFKIKDHTNAADTLKLFLNSVYDFCISDSVVSVRYKDNHLSNHTIVSEGANRMFYIETAVNAYYVKFTADFKDVQFIIDNSDVMVEGTIVLIDQIQFNCNGSISNCKSSDNVCIESKRRGGCVQR